nr:BofC C-terminal domain-containing protein [Cohnella lubricantis]
MIEESVDDLSPECRKSAYMAIDPVGYLSIFDGPPQKKRVIRTFFQLDVKSLESSFSKERLKEMANGIRVSDKDEFNSVLSTFSEFALPRATGVLKQENAG